MTFTAQTFPRGRDVREAFPQVGACLADVTFQSTIDIEPVPGMSVILEPHCSYLFTGYVGYRATAGVGLRLRLDAPRLSTGQWGIHGYPLSGGGGSPLVMTGETVGWLQETLASGDEFLLGGLGVGNPLWARLEGSVQVAGIGGALQLGATQAVATATVSVVSALSWIEAVKIGEN